MVSGYVNLEEYDVTRKAFYKINKRVLEAYVPTFPLWFHLIFEFGCILCVCLLFVAVAREVISERKLTYCL